MKKTEKAFSLLAELGNTPEQMAAKLEELGYKGTRYNGRYCPCGTYLEEKMGIPIGVYVSSLETIRQEDDYEYFQIPDDEKGNMVSIFVMKFDRGEFPQLVKQKD